MQFLAQAARNTDLFRTACLFAGILSLLLLVPGLPLTFMHIAFWAICLVSLWVAATSFALGKALFGCLFVASTILFNPFVQVIQSAPWMWIADGAAAALLFAASQTIDPSDLNWFTPET